MKTFHDVKTYKLDGILYINFDEIPRELQQPFERYLIGKKNPPVEGVRAVYEFDWRVWNEDILGEKTGGEE